MNLAAADRAKLRSSLDQLSSCVEEVILSGLTTASKSTQEGLTLAFHEASRLKLLRLGSTLRGARDELERFVDNSSEFSRRRLVFFLNRSWLLSRGLSEALRQGDDAQFERLVWMPTIEPVPRLEVVTLGVGKRSTNAFCAFEFRLRTVADAGSIPAGSALTWSCLFPVKPGSMLPAEGFLHVPQKQKFVANVFLEGAVVHLKAVGVSRDGVAAGRITLNDASTVEAGKRFTQWSRFAYWSAQPIRDRLRTHRPGPLDLDVELQDEVVLHDWTIGTPEVREAEAQRVYPLTVPRGTFEAVVSSGREGDAATGRLDELMSAKGRPPLFGVLHFERGRLILQPLALLEKNEVTYLTISDEKVDRAALLKALVRI